MSEINAHLGDKTYCLRYPNGKYVAVDSGSGGYPYEVANILEAQRFPRSEAIRYQEIFKGDLFFIVKIVRIVFEVL